MTETAATAVDLSRLPAPQVVEPLDYEAIYAAMLADLRRLVPDFDATVESDPAVKLLQVCAYRELLLRARVNDAARAVMPAFARGSDLDQLAALMGITRHLLSAGDASRGIPPTYEDDDDFRRRLVLAPEGFSVAGPAGAYVFHALSADRDVLDASAISPAPGDVLVSVLSRTGDGTAPDALVATVDAYLSAETRRPLTDHVRVRGATIVPYVVEAVLTTYAGPDAATALAQARANVAAHAARCHRLGLDITRSSLFAALHVEGVQNVALHQPAADVVVDRTAATWCSGINVTVGGVDE
ncbi:baseplate J/gp47 family protein [Sphingomonas sp. BK069]|uniref:baseplate assembly protein n=1 Tax=Sphingomonas sp. BK069 TaxID=2586979 RepID=UPI0016142E2E|nr:baseplate J/gp47 family protein [Sphingomonas sp. BK069]MBB3346039.1 phage-related baseplate assembly protein [Sphingomonas sp. BK069]